MTKLRKNVIFEWTAEDVALIKQIKENFKTLSAIYLPKTGDKLILETDASEACWGGVLKAIPSNLWYDKEIPLSENGIRLRKNLIPIKLQKEELICRYNPGTFKPNEQKYIIFEKELLIIKLAIKSFHIYLALENFIVLTDNKVIRDFLINKKPIE